MGYATRYLQSSNIDELARPGLGYRLLHAPLNVLSTIGTILDTPGAAVRGLIAGLNEGPDIGNYLAGLLYDPKRRVSGTELLGGERDKFSWGGLAAEILTDPLTYLTLGTGTVAGKAAGRASKATELITRARKLDPAIEKLIKVENTLPKHFQGSSVKYLESTIRPDALSMYRQGRDILSQLPKGTRVLKGTLKEQALAGQRAAVQLDIPFTGIQKPLATLPGLVGTLQPFADAGSKAAKFLNTKSLFATRTGDKDLDYLVESLLGSKRLGSEEASQITKRVFKESKTIAKEMGVPQREVLDTVRNLLEQTPEALEPALSKLAKSVSKARDLEAKYVQRARIGTETDKLFQGLHYLLNKQLQQATKVRILSDEIPGFLQKKVTEVTSKIESLTQRLADTSGDWRQFPELTRTRATDVKEIKSLIKKLKQYESVPTARYTKAVEELDSLSKSITSQIKGWRASAKKLDKTLSPEFKVRLGIAQERTGKLEKSLTDLVRRKLDFQRFQDAADPRLKVFAEKNREYFDKLFRVAQENGVTFDPSKSSIGYITHRLTSEGHQLLQRSDVQDWLEDQIREKLNIKFGRTSITRSRTIPDSTIDEINKLFQEKYNVPYNIMETDFLKLIGSYAKNIAREEAKVKLVQDLVHLKAQPLTDEDKGLKSVTELLSSDRIGRFEGFDLTTDKGLQALKRSEWANMGVRETEITQFLKLIKNIETPIAKGGIVGFLDKTNTVFRRGFLSAWPGSNVRDFVNGAVYNFIEGVNPKIYKEAIKTIDNLNFDDEFTKVLYRDGVLGESIAMEARAGMEGIGGDPLKNRFTRGFFQVTDKPLGTKKLPIGVEARQHYDNINRLALYLDKKAKGLSHIEAAEAVKKWHFHYDDLSLAERKYMRRGMLFYSFVRKNTPLMLGLIFSNPRVPLTYARLTGKTNANLNRPDWMPDMIQFGDTYFGYNLSFEDYDLLAPDNSGFERSLEKVAGRLSPAFSVPLQVMSGKQFYSGRNIQGGIPEFLLKSSPVGRHAGAISQFGERPANVLSRFLTGANIQRHKAADLKLSSEKEQLQQALERSYRAGNATKFDVYSSDDERVKALISELQKRRQQQ